MEKEDRDDQRARARESQKAKEKDVVHRHLRREVRNPEERLSLGEVDNFVYDVEQLDIKPETAHLRVTRSAHEDGEDPVHMVETTTTMGYFTDIPEDIPSDVAVQDGGAASFLGSYMQIRKYLLYLVDLGYDVNTVEIYRCKKGFKYGNSEKLIATTCLMLPIFAGHRRRHVLCYAVGGSCPILIGRPLLERLGLTVDYSERKYKWKGQHNGRMFSLDRRASTW